MRSTRYFHSGIFRDIIVMVLVLLCFFYSAGAQNIQVDSRLDKASIPIGDQTVLHLVARIPAKSIIFFPELKDSIGKIKIVKGAKADTAFDKKDPFTVTITHNYTITSFDTGIYVIPELEFRAGPASFKTGTATLRITSVPVDTTKSFYDIKQPFAVSYTFLDWLRDHWLLVVVNLVSVVLIIAIIYYFKSRPKAIIIKKSAPALSADTIALNKLFELRDKKLWQQDEIKKHYSELTDILREYLEVRYHIKTQEQTSNEIVTALKYKDIPVNARNSLKQLLALADLVKFAKEKPLPAENEQSIEEAINFVRKTKAETPTADQNKELPG